MTTHLRGGLTVDGIDVMSIGSVPMVGSENHIIYVDSTHPRANDSNIGTDRANPKATLASALSAADSYDLIVVMPGHVETVNAAAAINMDTANVTIWGLGVGDARPVLNFTTTANATAAINAAGCWIKNIRASFAVAATVGLDINATAIIEDVELVAGAEEAVSYIDIGGASANAADKTVLRNVVIRSTAAGATNGISISVVNDRVQIIDPVIEGDFANAPIYCNAIATNLRIEGFSLSNTQTGDYGIEVTVAATGIIENGTIYGDTAAALLLAGSLRVGGGVFGKIPTIAQAFPLPVAGYQELLADTASLTFANPLAPGQENILMITKSTALGGNTTLQPTPAGTIIRVMGTAAAHVLKVPAGGIGPTLTFTNTGLAYIELVSNGASYVAGRDALGVTAS